MRVALLARGAHPLHEPGGMERAVYHLAKQLCALGHQPVLVTRPALHDQPFPGEVLTVPYERWHVGAHGGILDRTLNYPVFSDRVGAIVASQARAGRIDVIDAQGLVALGYLLRRERDPALRAPVVLNPQGMEEHKTRGLKRLMLSRLRRLSRRAARLADRVVSTDDVLTGEIPRYLGVDPARVVLLRNGVDVGEIMEVTPEDVRQVVAERLPALGDAAPVMISVGRLEAYKGFGDILTALMQSDRARRLPRGWAWIVLGDGGLRPEMQRRIAEHDGAVEPAQRIAEHIHFAGWVRDLPLLHACYARADIFVHATHYEGSSIVTIEAMAHSLPVVATRAGGIPDKVIVGVNGLLVEPGDVPALAQSIETLANDVDLHRAMGLKSRERVRGLFSWEKIVRDTVEVYEALIHEVHQESRPSCVA